MMGDFSKKAQLRFAMLNQGIPFDELEPKSSIEVGDSSSKSLDNDISVQDLKKGTFYEDDDDEIKREKIEDIEKIEDERSYNEYYEMAMEKDKEMYGDLDNIRKKTKMMKKIEKNEKKKIVKHYADQEKRRERPTK